MGIFVKEQHTKHLDVQVDDNDGGIADDDDGECDTLWALPVLRPVILNWGGERQGPAGVISWIFIAFILESSFDQIPPRPGKSG